MNPQAPAAAPLTANTNLPYGQGQAASDQALGSNILSFLPTQEQQTARVNPSDTSMLPTINPQYSTVTAPTAPVVDPNKYGTNLTGYNTAVQQATQGLTGSENTAYQQALNDYQKNISQFGNLTGVYNNLANQYNLPGYQQDVNSLQGLLQNLNQDVNAQTTLGGGLMTQAARDEAYANQRNPLDLALSNASREYATGQTNVNNLLGAYETSLQNALKPEELNLSNLPTLFGQTNQAAQEGYGQGATAIQNTIANRAEQERLNISQQQLALQQKQFNAQYGSGTMTDLLNKLSNGQIPGMSLKNTGVGGGAGYNFQVANAPASAGTWAATNNLPINYVLSTMASKGDKNAANALGEITSAGGVTQSIVNKYPDIFWTAAQSSNTNNNNKKTAPKSLGNSIAQQNLSSLSSPSIWNLGGIL